MICTDGTLPVERAKLPTLPSSASSRRTLTDHRKSLWLRMISIAKLPPLQALATQEWKSEERLKALVLLDECMYLLSRETRTKINHISAARSIFFANC